MWFLQKTLNCTKKIRAICNKLFVFVKLIQHVCLLWPSSSFKLFFVLLDVTSNCFERRWKFCCSWQVDSSFGVLYGPLYICFKLLYLCIRVHCTALCVQFILYNYLLGNKTGRAISFRMVCCSKGWVGSTWYPSINQFPFEMLKKVRAVTSSIFPTQISKLTTC